MWYAVEYEGFGGVLLDHKHLATHSQKFVKFIYHQFLE